MERLIVVLRVALHRATLILLKTILRPDLVLPAAWRATRTLVRKEHLWFFFSLKCWWCGEERRLYTEEERGTPWCSQHGVYFSVRAWMRAWYEYVYELIDLHPDVVAPGEVKKD